MPTPWQYDSNSKRYRSPDGRFIGQSKMLALRDQFNDALKKEASDLTNQASSGRIGMGDWLGQMRDLIKQSYIDEYTLARGGRSQMTQSDWGKIGAMVRAQYGYLAGLFRDMTGSAISPATMTARAAQYVASATQAYETGKAAALGILDLPAMPGDGTSECLSNCRCSWDIKDAGDHWEATWTLGATDHCTTCSERAVAWAPLIVPK